jgi:sulfite exporter TauE/SafE
MLISLLITAFLMGLAGIPHCAAMCATPCAMAAPQGLPLRALLGRSTGYALLGALAAGATAVLSSWSRTSAVLQPFWVMLLAASALLGVWMMWWGAVPQVLQNHGLAGYRSMQRWVARHEHLVSVRWLARCLPFVLGAAWAALPCGLLYGAVTIAALAPHAAQGALVMLAFSLPGAWALWWWPRQLQVWSRAPGQAGSTPSFDATSPGSWIQAQAVVPVLWMKQEATLAPASQVTAGKAGRGGGRAMAMPWWRRLVDPRWAARLSGLCLAGASSWALWHRLLDQWRVWCA